MRMGGKDLKEGAEAKDTYKGGYEKFITSLLCHAWHPEV